MGCEGSQISEAMPQESHVLNQDKNHQKQTPGTTPPPKPETKFFQTPSQNKENAAHGDVKQKSKKIVQKNDENKRPISATKLSNKSENRKSGIPIIDHSSLALKQKSQNKQNHEQKEEFPRSQCKIDNDKAEIGPSSKSIQMGQMLSEDKNLKTGIEGFPIADVLEKKINQSKQENKVQQMSAPSPSGQSKGQPSRFAIEHWEKTQEDNLSRTERLKKVDQMQIQKQEVILFLQKIWDYERECLNTIINKLEEQEQNKLLGNPILVS